MSLAGWDPNPVSKTAGVTHLKIYQISGIAPTKNFENVRPVFQAVTQSFRPLSQEERNNIREKRLRLVKAQGGETLSALVARSHSAWKPNQVAVANGLTGDEFFERGRSSGSPSKSRMP